MRSPRRGFVTGLAVVCGVALACPAEHAGSDASTDAAQPDAAPADRQVPPECSFGALAQQAQGQPCGCPEDCQPNLDRCERNLFAEPMASRYCTSGCRDDRDCAAGYGCDPGLPLMGQEPFCQRCLSSVPSTVPVGERCICTADCQRAVVDGRPRATACVSGACAISPCSAEGETACPLGQACERGSDGVSACVPCVNRVPAGQGAACACADDCELGLQCVRGTCRRPCVEAANCDEGQECREQALGGGLCTALAEGCGGLADHAIGDRCACNADCVAEAPTCLTLELGPFPATMCTQRPCNPLAEQPCPEGSGGAFRCCLIPTLLPATCLPPALANLVASYALCSP